MVYQTGPEEWVLPHQSCSRTRVEHSFPHQEGTIPVHRDAIWIDERPCYVQGNHGYDLQR